MLEYLIGCGILAVIWLVFFLMRKDLRKPMLWSGGFYWVFITGMFFLWWIPSKFLDFPPPIVPHYWSPDTLFNLGRLTGGYAIEDAIFMLLVGGIAAAIYEIIFHERISPEQQRSKHVKALLVAYVGAFLFMFFFNDLNLIYPLIFSGFLGAVVIWVERKDLARHSLYGGAIFVSIYFVAFLLFNALFPEFISRVYVLRNLSDVLILGVPLEELLYALSFGLFWAPMYEYEHGYVDVEK